MEIRKTRLIPYQLSLRQAWASAHGSFTQRRGWLVELTSSSGLTGHGDCAPLPTAGTELLEQAETALQAALSGMPGQRPEAVLRGLPPMSATPAARCGIETALLDLLSRQGQCPLRQWLMPKAANQVKVNAVLGGIGGLTPKVVQRVVDEGFQTLKVKVGLGAVNDEVRRLQALSENLPPGVRLRLDANRAWEPAEARAFLQGVAPLPVESLEEPLRREHLKRLKALQAETPIHLALDESLNELDIRELLEIAPVRRIVLKPMAQGGLLPSMKLAQAAIKRGMEVVITTTVDSAYGVAAATHLAAALTPSQPSLCHGLATSGWLANDLGAFAPAEQGLIKLPDGVGLGVKRS